MFCSSSSLATHLPGMAVKADLTGDAATPALTRTLSATAEGQSSTTGLRCGAAKTHLAMGKESLSTTLGLVRRTKKGG